MRAWQLGLVVLCGCDKLFSLDAVADPPPIDAVDAPPDAAEPRLTKWMPATPLPAGRDYNHQHAAFVGDTLYLIGGYASGEQDVVYRATASDGVLGSWTQTAPLSAPRAVGDVVTIGNRIYVVGGANGGGAQSSVYVGEAAEATGDIASWSPVSPLPEPRKAHAAAAANGYLYAFGGGDTLNTRQTTVFYASVRADGSLGVWQPSEPLPAPRANLGGVAARGYLYAIGGDDADVSGHATVWYAALDPDDGHVGPWIATTSLPTARTSLVAVTDSSHIYVIGGWASGATSEVLYSKIGDDGQLGAWDSNEPLLTPRHRHAGVLANGHVFVLGGAEAPTSVEHAAQGGL